MRCEASSRSFPPDEISWSEAAVSNGTTSRWSAASNASKDASFQEKFLEFSLRQIVVENAECDLPSPFVDNGEPSHHPRSWAALAAGMAENLFVFDVVNFDSKRHIRQGRKAHLDDACPSLMTFSGNLLIQILDRGARPILTTPVQV